MINNRSPIKRARRPRNLRIIPYKASYPPIIPITCDNYNTPITTSNDKPIESLTKKAKVRRQPVLVTVDNLESYSTQPLVRCIELDIHDDAGELLTMLLVSKLDTEEVCISNTTITGAMVYVLCLWLSQVHSLRTIRLTNVEASDHMIDIFMNKLIHPPAEFILVNTFISKYQQDRVQMYCEKHFTICTRE